MPPVRVFRTTAVITVKVKQQQFALALGLGMGDSQVGLPGDFGMGVRGGDHA